MNGDGAARLFFVAADACLIFRAIGNQLTHLIPLGLGIDGEGFALWNVDALVCIEGGAVGKDQVDSSFDLNSVGNSYCSLDGIPYVVFKGEGFFIFVEYGSFYVLLGSVFVQIFRRAAYAKTVFIEDVLCRFTLEITVFTGILVVLLIQINRGEVSMTFVTGLNHHGLAGGVERTTSLCCPFSIRFRCRAIQRFAHGEFEVGIISGVGCNRKSHAALGTDSAAGNGDGAAFAAGAFAAADACGIPATFGLNVAAGNVDGAAISTTAATDACAAVSAEGFNVAAVNGDIAAFAAVAAADACSIGQAISCNLAAMDGDGAATLEMVAADACLISRAFGNQRTHPLPLGLGIDGEGIALGNVDALFGIEGGAVGKDQVGSYFDLNSVGNSYCSLDGIPYVVFKGEGFFIFVEYGSFYVLLGSICVQIFRRAAYAKTVFIEVVICRFTLEITVFTGNLVVVTIQINRCEGIMNYIARLNLHGPVVGVEHTTVVLCPLGIGFRYRVFQQFAHGEFEVGIISGVGCNRKSHAALGTDSAAGNIDGAGEVTIAVDACGLVSTICRDAAAGNIDDAAAAALAAADACGMPATVGCNVAAVNIDGVAAAAAAAADACGIIATRCIDTAAGNVDHTTVAAVEAIDVVATATANACGLVSTICRDAAAGDFNVAAVAVFSAANACASITTAGCDGAAEDVNVVAVFAAATATANACGLTTALCFNGAAIDVDRTRRFILIAADGCLSITMVQVSIQPTRTVHLAVDAQDCARRNVDALSGIEAGVFG